MRLAISLAEEAKKTGDFPFGAVIVRNGEVLSSGKSEETILNDVTKHAELMAVRGACEKLGTKDLSDCTLYTSGEPCTMCASCAFQADIRRVVIGASRSDLPHFFRKRNIGIQELASDAKHDVEIVTGVLNTDAIALFDGVRK